MRSIPNAIALLRAAMVVPIVLLLQAPETVAWALVLFCLAALTDALDGALARGLGATTRLGAFLDPLADKVLVLGTLLALLLNGAVDPFPVAVIFIREPLITGLRGLAVARGRFIPSSGSGKAKAALQSVAVVAQLTAFAFPALGVAPVADVLLGIVAVVTVATGVEVAQRALAAAGGLWRPSALRPARESR